MRTVVAASSTVLLLTLAPIGVAGAQASPAQREAMPAPAVADTGRVTLRGIVRDTAGRPLLGAQVMTAEATTITDEDGRFELRDLRADTLHLLIRRIGHQPASITLAPDDGVIVEFAATLVPTVVELGTIVIEGRTMERSLWRNGFYDRQRAGHGTYFDPEQLGRHSSIVTALRMTPSVQVTRTADGRAIAMGRSGTGYCPLAVYLDGVLVRWASDVGLETLVLPGDVLAMEVYPRAVQVPGTLRSAGPASGGGGLPSPGSGAVSGGPVDCGALMVWSKPFGNVE